MSTRKREFITAAVAILAAILIVGCGSGTPPGGRGGVNGSLVTFGTDVPICDVESFSATITSATLVPQGGGTAVSLITSATPEIIDFARLADFTNILSNAASVPPATYSQFQVTLTNPQLIALNTLTSPPTPVTIPATLATQTFTITISPALVVTANNTSGLTFDFNLAKSVEVDNTGKVTGTIAPQITAIPTTPSGGTVGEATSLYGIVGTPSTSALPSGFTGSFPLTLQDGTGLTLTILSNSTSVFEGDGVTSFSNLAANSFAEVDATVDTSGRIIAQTVDVEEPTSSANQKSAILGKIITVARDTSGNATGFSLLVDDEVPDLSGAIPLHSALNVALVSTTNYFTNLRAWNREAFTFGPKTVGLAQKVAVFGVLGTGTPLTLTANQVFLRPRDVVGTFQTLQAAGSDGKTGGFTMIPCGGLFGGHPITVLTYPNTTFLGAGVSPLNDMTPANTVGAAGLLFYEQTSGGNSNGGSWAAPTWVMQARGVHQLQ